MSDRVDQIIAEGERISAEAWVEAQKCASFQEAAMLYSSLMLKGVARMKEEFRR